MGTSEERMSHRITLLRELVLIKVEGAVRPLPVRPPVAPVPSQHWVFSSPHPGPTLSTSLGVVPLPPLQDLLGLVIGNLLRVVVSFPGLGSV